MKNKIFWGFLASSLSVSVFAHGGESNNGENFLGHGGMMGGYGMEFGWLIPLILVIAFGYFIYNSSSNRIRNTTARDKLDERFTNG